jgi:hypothetical protein
MTHRYSTTHLVEDQYEPGSDGTVGLRDAHVGLRDAHEILRTFL